MATLDLLLKNSPACRPPYLTGRGILWVVGTIALCIGSVIAQALEMPDFAMLGMALAAFLTLILSWIYVMQLRIWRAVRTGKLEVFTESFQNLWQVDDEIKIQCRVRNGLSTDMRILAMHWHHSAHLEVTSDFAVTLNGHLSDAQTEVCLAQKSETHVVFGGRATTIGKGAVYGVGILCADNWGIMRSESHIECPLEVSVLPCYHKEISHSDSQSALEEQILQATRQIGDGELDAVRPWTTKDTIRRIAWRGFARHQELSVWYRTKTDQKQLVCLVDASSHAVATGKNAPCSSALSETLVTLARFIHDFETVTIITYGAHGCDAVAEALPPTRAIRTFEDWFLSATMWHPPKNSEDEKWSDAASKLWADFRLYKHVDFSKTERDGLKIDLQGLVNWARADKMTSALAKNDQTTFQKCLHQSYNDLLLELLKQRFHPRGHTLEPQAVPPSLCLALPMLKRAFQTDEASVLAWFSPFSAPYQADELQALAECIQRQNVRAYGICLPMPTESLNFLQPQGCRNLENTILRLEGAMTFIP